LIAFPKSFDPGRRFLPLLLVMQRALPLESEIDENIIKE
jgi:hypothetical protein